MLEIFIVSLLAQTSYYISFCSGETAIVFCGILLRNLQVVVVVVDWLVLDGLFVDCGPFRTGSVILYRLFYYLNISDYIISGIIEKYSIILNYIRKKKIESIQYQNGKTKKFRYFVKIL